MEKNELKKYYINNELDLDSIVDDYTPYVTTVINNGASKLSFEDKEEIFADTFFVLWKNRNSLTINTSLSAYLAGISRNLIKEKYRKLKINYDIDELSESMPINMYETDRELIIDVEKKVKGLKKLDKEIFYLFYYDSKSIKDIARELNISERNVKTKLHRIRQKIKNELKGGK